MFNLFPFSSLFFYLIGVPVFALLPPGSLSPLAQTCGPTGSIVCMKKYAAVMPYHFFRQPSTNGSYEDTYASTSVPSDPSFSLMSSADFLVFDQDRGLNLLGPNPSYEFMYKLNDGECRLLSSLGILPLADQVFDYHRCSGS